jgi:probable HAF family extracellular repeat protein
VSSALGVNDHGEVVGMAANELGQPSSFQYRDAMAALPVPPYSSAVSINGVAQVVGSAEGTYGYLLDGDILTRLDAIPAVAERGWHRLEPKSINDRGWIVGTATNAQGDLRAFLLLPAQGPRPKPDRIRS